MEDAVQRTKASMVKELQCLRREVENLGLQQHPPFRRDAGMTGKPVALNKNGGNWDEFSLKLKAYLGNSNEA